jgi:hypothetical protein
MNAELHPARARSGFGALLDAMIGLSVAVGLLLCALLLLNGDNRDQLARFYARQFHVTDENACPRYLGKPFWFACASEARRPA